ncbi:hypothetical protein EniLVp02_0167 [Vibrio phage EniLVp02]
MSSVRLQDYLGALMLGFCNFLGKYLWFLVRLPLFNQFWSN